MLVSFDGPVDGQTDGTMGWQLGESVQEDGIGQVPQFQRSLWSRRDNRFAVAS